MNLSWYKKQEFFKRTTEINNILFICSGNTCRSPAAEYFFKAKTSWWSGIHIKSRGLNVDATIALLKSKGIQIDKLMIEPECIKVLGKDLSSVLSQHQAIQLQEEDIVRANLILTMERELRDTLRAKYPHFGYKIFTFRGFIEKVDDNSTSDINVGNPFVPCAIRAKEGVKEGNKKYYTYLHKYGEVIELIKAETRQLIEIIYAINAALGEKN